MAEIQQLALIGSDSSLHSEACNALGASDGVIAVFLERQSACELLPTISGVRTLQKKLME